jgi:Fe-S-cluster-containing hydrogenase component 2
MLKLISSVEDVRKQTDEKFVRNAIFNYLGPMLGPDAVDALMAGGVELRRFNTNDVITRDGDQADGLYLIRRGSVTVSKVIDGKDKILSYVSAGNYVGEMALLNDAPRSATITATVLTEILVLGAEGVKKQIAANPKWRASIEKQVLARTQKNVVLENSTGREGDLMRFLLGQGIGEASDVLLIDETLCVQCNNCEVACAETHDGTSRLRRELGPTFANIHVPSACRHCEHPHCMKECPPDAISRSSSGEVLIGDSCIGCGNCQRNCPYGVIQMAVQKPPKRGGGLSWLLFGLGAAPGKRQPDYDPNALKKAVKCDLCSGIEGGASCVRACPTGAAIRVSPDKYFKMGV